MIIATFVAVVIIGYLLGSLPRDGRHLCHIGASGNCERVPPSSTWFTLSLVP